MPIYDTQVISYDCNGHHGLYCKQGAISAITGLEFLQVQSKARTKARYYIPSPHWQNRGIAFTGKNRDHPFPKHITDSVLMHVGPKHGAYIEFSNLALSHVINERRADIFEVAVQFQKKDEIKMLKRRYEYLIQREIRCIPLSPAIIDIAFELLADFLANHNPKQNFRNTLNDMLIFATALNTGRTLVTEDSLLLRFIQETCGGIVTTRNQHLYYTPPHTEAKPDPQRRESKGYINKGWSYKIRN